MAIQRILVDVRMLDGTEHTGVVVTPNVWKSTAISNRPK